MSTPHLQSYLRQQPLPCQEEIRQCCEHVGLAVVYGHAAQSSLHNAEMLFDKLALDTDMRLDGLD